MSHRRKDPLRALTPEERKELGRLSRSHSAPATALDRARALLRLPMGYLVGPEQCRLIRRQLDSKVLGQYPMARMSPSGLPGTKRQNA